MREPCYTVFGNSQIGRTLERQGVGQHCATVCRAYVNWPSVQPAVRPQKHGSHIRTVIPTKGPTVDPYTKIYPNPRNYGSIEYVRSCRILTISSMSALGLTLPSVTVTVASFGLRVAQRAPPVVTTSIAESETLPRGSKYPSTQSFKKSLIKEYTLSHN